MKIKIAIDEYVRHKQNLGFDFADTAYILIRFNRSIGDIDVEDLKPEIVKAFIYGRGSITQTVHYRHRAVRGLFRYLLARGYVRTSPVPSCVPKVSQKFIPNIYSRDELRRILNAARAQSDRNYLQPTTLYTLILILYACGLRLGEALRLTLGDVDRTECTFTIRDTKFYKTRCVPFSADLNKVLQEYLRFRSDCGHPAPPEALLLVTRQSKPIKGDLARDSFKRVCTSAGVRRRHPHQRYGPRLHDLRHTFAVHRLTACYEEGDDPQRLLPKLSTYMGHAEINATKKYLTLTPELLRYASERFEKYATTGGHRD